jgi:hypothetical protein
MTRQYVHLNDKKIRDLIVMQYFKKHGYGTSFSEFVKYKMVEMAKKELSKKEFQALLNTQLNHDLPQGTDEKKTPTIPKKEKDLSDLLDDFDIEI